ncbi:hypothetical protein BZ163_11090 [Pseudomonas sp. VI4.1]|nr:hypothetical protein BZ163_11090 [Pseudomonas sp. VI4.1]
MVCKRLNYLLPERLLGRRLQLKLPAQPHEIVGASLLAKDVNDNAGSLIPRSALRFFASKLAPA